MFDQLRSEGDHKNVLEQGFTLVELLIVIIILGILAGIVVFAVGSLQSNSQKSACATEAQTFVTAYQAYKAANNGNAPSGVTANNAAGATTVLTALTASSNGGPFLTKSPNPIGSNGFYDDTDTGGGAANKAALQTSANSQAGTVNRPVWAFLPMTGEVVQSSTGTPATTCA